MKRKMTLTASVCCLIFAVLASCHRLPVQAAEREVPPYILDVQRDCKLDIKTDKAQAAAGEKLSVYQVGRIDATSLSLSFVLNEPYEDLKVDLLATGNTQRKQTIETLCDYIAKNKLEPDAVAKLNQDGEVQLKVPQGAYLICQAEAEESKTRIQATLISVPYVSETLDGWIYDMDVQLKAVTESVPTGDSQNLVGYAALAVLAVLLLVFQLFARRRSKKK